MKKEVYRVHILHFDPDIPGNRHFSLLAAPHLSTFFAYQHMLTRSNPLLNVQTPFVTEHLRTLVSIT